MLRFKFGVNKGPEVTEAGAEATTRLRGLRLPGGVDAPGSSRRQLSEKAWPWTCRALADLCVDFDPKLSHRSNTVQDLVFHDTDNPFVSPITHFTN